MSELEELRENLEKALRARDDEAYHIYFDALLEAKLNELAPEWMASMHLEYQASRLGRWCA